jgi:hypothetical protein
MTLLVLLCVCLVLGGWTVRREVCAAIGALRLHVLGVRVRAAARPAQPVTHGLAAPPPPAFPPPPTTATRPGP